MPRLSDGQSAAGWLARPTGRRRFLSQAAKTVAAGAGAALVPGSAAAKRAGALSPPASVARRVRFPGVRVGRRDPRYDTLRMGFNERWVGKPAYIQLVGDTRQVARCVREAVRRRLRITVRGGGHCYEDFVAANTGGVIIDMSPMHAVYRAADGSLCLEGGCTIWDVYEQLYKNYGVTLPGGSCYSVGLGGHVVGGGYGLLSRKFGLTVDYLAAVELVVVGRNRSVRVVTAAKDDPDTADLFWAHTGGGGGNFGVITRYYFKHLPRPPQQVYVSNVAWNWEDIDATRFHTLLSNYGRFMHDNSNPSSRYADLFSLLKLTHRSAGQLVMTTQLAGADRRLLDSFLGQICHGVASPVDQVHPVGHQPAVPKVASTRRMPWLQATQTLNGSGPNQRAKYKSAYMIEPFPNDQIDAIYRALSDPNYVNPQALLQVDSYGCKINARKPRQTAVAHRSSIMKLQYQTYWTDPGQDDYHLRWIRRFYEDVYRPTGGMPRPNGVTDGCYVNYADADLGDWWKLYYKDNYARLQAVKARWDPYNIFRHRQSIRLP